MVNARDRLIADVRKRRSAVTSKIYRIKRSTGVNIAGERDDPRRVTRDPLKMNTAQLRKYYRQLDSFMSRDVAFIPGANGTLISKSRWREYVEYQSKYNKIGEQHLKGISAIEITGEGMTVGQREATFNPDSLRAQGDVVNRPYSRMSRTPENINGGEALERLIVDLKRKTSKAFLPAEIAKSREQMNDMLDIIGNQSLTSKMNGLSDKQFDVLWNYTNFATNLSLMYQILKIKSSKAILSPKDRWYESVAEDAVEDIDELTTWAHTLPKR